MGRLVMWLPSGVLIVSLLGCGDEQGEGSAGETTQNSAAGGTTLGTGGSGNGAVAPAPDGNNNITLATGGTTGDGDMVAGDGDASAIAPIDGCNPTGTSSECAGVTYEGENVPLDIYIMFDQSYSMSCDISGSSPWQDVCCGEGCEQRIDPVRLAVDDFLSDPESSGITVGMGVFGQMELGATSCDAADYSTATVEMGLLPAHAPTVTAALSGLAPTGETPTAAAIEGACNYIQQWHTQQPLHKKVILLVTDGVPEAPSSAGCNPTVEDAAAAAAACLSGDPQVPTYVLGVGQALDNLAQIAEAGGTEQAYLVDGDVQTSVLEALNAIRSDASIPCTMTVPEPDVGTVDYGKVNIGICDSVGQTLSTYFVEDPAACQNGAWYYEPLGNGQVVQLCPQTCETVSVAGSSLVLSVGCETIVTPVR